MIKTQKKAYLAIPDLLKEAKLKQTKDRGSSKKNPLIRISIPKLIQKESKIQLKGKAKHADDESNKQNTDLNVNQNSISLIPKQAQNDEIGITNDEGIDDRQDLLDLERSIRVNDKFQSSEGDCNLQTLIFSSKMFIDSGKWEIFIRKAESDERFQKELTSFLYGYFISNYQ